MGKRENNKEETREAILRASRKAFSSGGYDTTRMEEIAAAAGVSKATLYNYFPNKESLLIGTVDDVLRRVKEAEDNARSNRFNRLEQLYSIFNVLVICSMKYPVLSRRIAYLNTLPGSSLYGCFDPIFDILLDHIDLAKTSGHFHADADAECILETLLGIYYVALNHWKYKWPDDEDEISGKLQETCTNLLKTHLA